MPGLHGCTFPLRAGQAGYHLLIPCTAPLTACFLAAPPNSLDVLSEAALLPFLIENGSPRSSIPSGIVGLFDYATNIMRGLFDVQLSMYYYYVIAWLSIKERRRKVVIAENIYSCGVTTS